MKEIKIDIPIRGHNYSDNLHWKTKDGRIIRFSELDERHLRNLEAKLLNNAPHTPAHVAATEERLRREWENRLKSSIVDELLKLVGGLYITCVAGDGVHSLRLNGNGPSGASLSGEEHFSVGQLRAFRDGVAEVKESRHCSELIELMKQAQEAVEKFSQCARLYARRNG